MAARRKHMQRQGRIACMAAEALIRTEGVTQDATNQYLIAPCQADDHMRDCIAHLCFEGKAAVYELNDGGWLVELGDFPWEDVDL